MTSRKTGRMVASESTLERDLFILLEFDPMVETFEEQPVRLTYPNDKGKTSSYTPDALCRLKTEPFDYLWQGSLFCNYFEFSKGLNKYRLKSLAPGWILSEVKYRGELFDKWQELKPKFKAGRAFAKGQSGCFRIFTEIELRTTVLENVKFLRRFRHRTPEPEDSRKILVILNELDHSYPNGILRRVAGDDRWETARQIPVLWYLIANFSIEFDWFKPLNMQTKLFSL